MISPALVLLAATPFLWNDDGKGRLELLANGATVLVYNYGPGRRCCYVYPLFTPAGVSMLDDGPRDHPHHRGVFWAWPVVETAGAKYDFWMLKGAADRFERFLEKGPATLAVENGWYAGERKIVREIVRLAVSPARDLELELTLEALAGPVTLRGSPEPGKSYGGFNARFAPRTGTVLRADGAVVTRDEDLNRHGWAELEGVYGGRKAVLRITADPANPGAPHQWCLRNYGFVGASVQPLTLEPGRPVTLRFRVRASD